jgi:hypothetical protein
MDPCRCAVAAPVRFRDSGDPLCPLPRQRAQKLAPCALYVPCCKAQSGAACRLTPGWRILALMGTKSRESIYGSSVRHSAERTAEARKEADRLACVAWNQRMLGFKGPAQPSPSLGDALNARYLYLEVRCPGCDTHQTVALNIVRRPKATPIHELERYMRCKDCSQVRGYPLQAEPSGRAASDQDLGT